MPKGSSPQNGAASRPPTGAADATQELISALLEHSPAPIYVVGTDGRYLVVNRAWELAAGKRREDVLGLKRSDLFPEEADAVREAMGHEQVVQRTNQPVTCEQKCERPDGVHYYHTVKFPLHNAAGQVESVGSISFDITRRKRVEHALAREYDLLQALLNHSLDAIYFKDTTSRFQRVNRAAARIMGLTDPQEAVGKTTADFFVPEVAQAIHADEQQVMQTNKPLVGKIRKVTRLDGGVHWLSTTKSPVVNEQGQVTGLVSIAREIAPPTDAPATPVATVLLVEDDPAIRQAERQILEAAGYRVVTARDGQQGLNVFMEHSATITVVVTDFAMPNLNGDAMLAEIRRVNATMPAVVVSGSLDDPQAARLRELPQTIFICKPVSGAPLLAAVRQAVGANLAVPVAREAGQ